MFRQFSHTHTLNTVALPKFAQIKIQINYTEKVQIRFFGKVYLYYFCVMNHRYMKLLVELQVIQMRIV